MTLRRATQLTLMGLALLTPFSALLDSFRLDHGSPFAQDLIRAGDILGVTLVHSMHKQARELPSLSSLVVLNLLALFLATLFQPGCRLGGCRLGGRFSGCKSNLLNLATSLEMYSTDNAGHYPHSLSQLTPKYLKTLPHCPSASQANYGFEVAQEPGAYTLFCRGCFHHAEGIDTPNYPRFSSHTGLVLR